MTRDELDEWRERLRPELGKPRPHVMRCGDLVPEVLRLLFPPPPPRGFDDSTPLNRMMGIPLVPDETLGRYEWRVLDVHGVELSRGDLGM